MAEDKLFYVGQKAFIEKEGRLLVLHDNAFGKTGGIDLPGGKIQEGETDIVAALKREVREETGLEISVYEPLCTWVYQFQRGSKVGKFVYLVGFRCSIVSGEIRLSDEHQGYQWVNKKEYEQLGDKAGHSKVIAKYFEQ